jgi:hypothetical protein
VALAAAVASGCGDPTLQRGRRDSAGVQIIENAPDSAGATSRLSVSSTPDLQIGETDGESPASFNGVAGVAQLADGAIVVLDGTREARFFDSAGQFLKKVGRSGSGPGEFQSMALVRATRYDSLVIIDTRNGRATVLGSPEGIRSERKLQRILGRPLGVLPTGRVLNRSIITNLRPGSAYSVASPAAFSIHDLESGGEDTILVDTIWNVVSQSDRGTNSRLDIPFDLPASAAAGPTSFFVTTGNVPEIREYDPSGRLQRLIRIGGEARRLTGAEFDSVVEMRMYRLVNPQATARLFAASPRPALYPTWQQLLVDADGWLWAERFRPNAKHPSVWSVFDTDGSVRGTIELPADLIVHQIGSDFVLGVWRNADDVDHVRRYRLHRDSL